MRLEHKIILSMYYKNSKNSISELRIDMIQMLLMLEGIFNFVEYKYDTEGQEIRIVPSSDKEAEYNSLVDDSDDECKAVGILTIDYAGVPLFSNSDYQQIHTRQAILPDARKNLYCLNILMEGVNSINFLNNRKSHIYYRFFSHKEGRDFVSFLVTMVLKLIWGYWENGDKGAKEVLEHLKSDYDGMKEVFDKREAFLRNLCHREQRLRDTYERNFFVNESMMFIKWAEKQEKAFEMQMIDFIFLDNEVSRKQALHLMRHILRIAKVFIGKDIDIWQDSCLDVDSRLPSPKEFENIDRVLDKLENEYNHLGFNIGLWANSYTEQMALIVDELSL